MRRHGSRHAGQTATEYMLVISVIVIAVVAAAYLFVPQFQNGVVALAQDVSTALATGQVGGVGFARHGGGLAGNPSSATSPTGVGPTTNTSSVAGINPNSATANNDVTGTPGSALAASPLGNPPAPPVNSGNGPVTAAHALDVRSGRTGSIQ